MKKKKLKRILEIIPGFLSWSVLFTFIVLFMFQPLAAVVAIIVFLLYWACRLFYVSILLIMAHHRVATKRGVDWLGLCAAGVFDMRFEEVVHVVLYTVYREPQEVLEESLCALRETRYPKERLIVVLAGEEREEGLPGRLEKLKAGFDSVFKDILVSIHPDGTPGEIPAKGANATYAAKKTRRYLEKNGYDLSRVVISCFDADTCPDRNYFACLTYNFLSHPKRYRRSFQPFPVYSNNIWRAPAFARVIEMGSTFWQLIESMRYEKFITFSSHSMSFKTLVEAGYWPVDLVSDDSLIFWKCFVRYNGDYGTYPLEVPVFMDIAVGGNFVDTIRVQYRQKRRWAWGVENFVFLVMALLRKESIPFFVKARRCLQILDNHVNWATWAIIITFITPMTLLWGRQVLGDSLILFNLSYINSIILHASSFIVILCIVMSTEFLPPRPNNISRLVHLAFIFQWALVPFISAFLGSFPSLDAQTRLMLGRYLYFQTTPKKRMESARGGA